VPTYQYACMDCAEDFEVRQSFSDPSLTECPACEGRLRKVFNAVGIVFKGSGFYRTDSRASADAGTSKANGSSESSKDTASDKAGSDAGKSGKTGENGTSSSDTSKSSERAAKASTSSAGDAA
jgi:putative FmdB family regulatory protein